MLDVIGNCFKESISQKDRTVTLPRVIKFYESSFGAIQCYDVHKFHSDIKVT